MGKNKIIQTIVRCKCCLGEDELKDLWTEYYNDGEREIYGEMLSDCFALNWEQPTIKSDSDIEHICSACVSKLHDAVSFKKEILLSAQLLLDEIKNDSYEEKMEYDSDTYIETEYLNIEYLEDEDIGKEKSVLDTKIEFPTKPIKELHKHIKSKSKNYTEEDLKKCLEAVKSKTLSQHKAALLYNVPRWTIRNALNKVPPANESVIFKEKKISPVREIKDGVNNAIESTKESGSVTRKRKKGCTEVKVEAVQSNTLSQCKETSYSVPKKAKHKETVLSDSNVPPLNERKKKLNKKNEKNMLNDDNLVDSLKSNESSNVPKKKVKEYSETDLKKCVESVQTNRLSECKASITFNVPQQAIHDALEESKLSSSSVPVELIKPNQSKHYSEEDFKKCLEAVKNRSMSRVQACKTYNVPMSSLYAAIKKMENLDEDLRLKSKDPFLHKFQENMDCIMKYTNATPFKGFLRAGYACHFCSKEYEQPKDLKKHTIQMHCTEDMLQVKVQSKRPVKLDVTDLKCNICDQKIETLESVLEHLSTVHEMTIHTDTQAFLIPFKFDSEVLKCAVCLQKYQTFKPLNDHMYSNHYKNYACTICGRGFINKKSLRNHSYRHETGVFKCKFCPKVFSAKVRRFAHEHSVHVLKNKRLRCGYCSERFVDAVKKKEHEVNVHNATQPVYRCQACSKTYKSQRSLTSHIQIFHLLLRPYKCNMCDFSTYKHIDWKSHLRTRHSELA